MDNNNFLKSLSKSLLADVRKVMEAKTHTVPKTDKEKKLAALAEPKDKITHADVLKGRGVVKEEEQIDELSTDTLRKYREKARDDAFDADAVDDERRLRKRSFHHNLAGKKIIKRGDTLRKEEVEADQEQIDEALDAAARYGDHHTAIKSLLKSISQHVDNHKADALKHRDYRGKKGVNWAHVGDVSHIHAQLADIHDRLAQQGEYAKEVREGVDLSEDEKAVLEELNANFEEIIAEVELDEAKRGRPAKNAPAGQDEEPAALGYQLRKAASINKPVHFMNGEKKEVAQGHINAFNDHMAARKTAADKAAFQKRAHKSHAEFVKAVSEKVPSSSKDTGEIVKYR